MTEPFTTNVAQDNAYVELQAGVVHNVTFYHLPPNASPEEKFAAAKRYLDARVRQKALDLIEEAITEGYVTTEVHFVRLIALLSGRTLRQLGTEELERLTTICAGLPRLDDRDEWTAGLRAVVRLLAPVTASDTDVVIKEIDALNQRQRDWIYGHLEALLEGALQDEMWQKSVALAAAQRKAGDRDGRIWKFFHPIPARPRVRPVRPASVPPRDWRRAIIGTVVFAVAVVELALPVMAQPGLDAILGLVASVAGLAVFCVGGADRHYRRARRRAKDAELSPPPRQRSWGPPPDGFTDKINKLVSHYFSRYVPRGTVRDYWLAQTAGIQWHLRTEIAEIYREQRIDADRVAWLIRYLVGDVRKRWEHGTLTAYRSQLRVPPRTVILCFGGLAILSVGGFLAVPAAVSAAPLPGVAWSLLAVASAVPAIRAAFRIVAEHRRVADDRAELAEQDRARWEAYHRWLDKLSDKPSDIEMAAWLEGDRKVLVDEAMRQCRLRPSQVIAHAFIEAPRHPCKKARYSHGPWRYSRYRLLLFLLTADGVRQVNIDLDFETATSRTTQRLNYRFDAVASVRIDGIATQQQTFELTLISGDPISVRVGEPNHDTRQDDEDPTKIAELSLDAAGLSQTLHVLEGVAAEGKEWVRHRRRRANDRLAKLANTLRGLFD